MEQKEEFTVPVELTDAELEAVSGGQATNSFNAGANSFNFSANNGVNNSANGRNGIVVG